MVKVTRRGFMIAGSGLVGRSWATAQLRLRAAQVRVVARGEGRGSAASNGFAGRQEPDTVLGRGRAAPSGGRIFRRHLAAGRGTRRVEASARSLLLPYDGRAVP